MKNIEYYMNLPYRTEIIKDTEKSSFVAYCPELEGCITAGFSAIDAMENLEAFGRKRQSVLFETQVHFTSNALAFHIECTCVFLKRTCVLLVRK